MNSIKQIEVIYDNRLVGRLALTKEGLCAFEYSAEWLNTGFSISPFELPLRSGVFIAKPRPFEGEFGVFDDCLRLPSIDYTHIFQVCAVLTHSVAEMWKVYRLMVFNYLIDNKDDHAKNFAFIYRDGDWHFAPAFDLLPSDGINGFRTTSINDKIEPTKEDIIAVAVKAGLNEKKAIEILKSIEVIIL